MNEEKQITPLTAVRAKCLDCSCGAPSEVRNCKVTNCALYPYRMGSRPKDNYIITKEHKCMKKPC